MRKNINKIVAFAIGISIMSGSIMPVFAADTTQNINIQNQVSQKPILTLDEVIKSAISISDTLAYDEMNISYIDKTNDIKEDQDDFNKVSDDVEDFHKDTADINLKKAKQTRDFDEDRLIKTVTDKYNVIVTNQMKINKAAKELEAKNKYLEDDKLRESLGMKRLIDVKSTLLEKEKLENSQKSSEDALKDLQYSFKSLTGKDLPQYSLEQDVNFEPLKIDGSIDEYLDNAIDSYLMYTEQLVNLNKDYYDRDYEKDSKITIDDMSNAEKDAKDAKDAKAPEPPAATDPDYVTKKAAYDKLNETYQKNITDTSSRYAQILASRLTYLSTKLSNYQQETTINKNKKDFKDQLKTLYTNLLASEANINYDKKNIEITNENLSNLKLKCDLGIITESAYNDEVVKSEQADIDLRAEIISYNITKEKLQKPWIAFSNS